MNPPPPAAFPRKVVFLTFHNWTTLRQGGFHKFAEATADADIDTVFFSFSRPCYSALKRDERLNARALWTLARGRTCQTPAGNPLVNCAWPTLDLPGPLLRWAPPRAAQWLQLHSPIPFPRFSRRFLHGADCFVFESCEAVFLLPLIRSHFPRARIVYRPSDPLLPAGSPRKAEAERRLLTTADLVLPVNDLAVTLFRERIPGFDAQARCEILPNGVECAPYRRRHPCPPDLDHPSTCLYVGARSVDWNAIFHAARALPSSRFVVVCPDAAPTPSQRALLRTLPNVRFHPGIPPLEVPAWVTNASAIMVPNPHGLHLRKPVCGISAKYYQAMAAQKPIVAYQDDPRLATYGISVTSSPEEFARCLAAALTTPSVSYPLDLDRLEWRRIQDAFLAHLRALPPPAPPTQGTPP